MSSINSATFKKSVSVLAVLAGASTQTDLDYDPIENNPYVAYTQHVSNVDMYAKPITNPNQCFGDNFEMFE